jgi:hypothetical protein
MATNNSKEVRPASLDTVNSAKQGSSAMAEENNIALSILTDKAHYR